jgi:large subunit ribosomal protein L35
MAGTDLCGFQACCYLSLRDIGNHHPGRDSWGDCFLAFQESCAEGGSETMPKQKSHKASRKRFRVTATGKLKRSQAGKKHLNTHKSRNRKRRLRGGLVTNTAIAKKYVKALLGVS